MRPIGWHEASVLNSLAALAVEADVNQSLA